jgi:hypothetical protein
MRSWHRQRNAEHCLRLARKRPGRLSKGRLSKTPLRTRKKEPSAIQQAGAVGWPHSVSASSRRSINSASKLGAKSGAKSLGRATASRSTEADGAFSPRRDLLSDEGRHSRKLDCAIRRAADRREFARMRRAENPSAPTKIASRSSAAEFSAAIRASVRSAGRGIGQVNGKSFCTSVVAGTSA